MLLPSQLRKSLKNISSKNQSLQDLLKSCSKAMSITNIEPYEGEIHNTKITFQLDKGAHLPEQERYEERVQFYNRLNLALLLDGVAIAATTLADIIDELNTKGFDFTEDDIELVGGQIVAKEQSVGYCNVVETTPDLSACRRTFWFAIKLPTHNESGFPEWDDRDEIRRQLLESIQGWAPEGDYGDGDLAGLDISDTIMTSGPDQYGENVFSLYSFIHESQPTNRIVPHHITLTLPAIPGGGQWHEVEEVMSPGGDYSYAEVRVIGNSDVSRQVSLCLIEEFSTHIPS